MSEEEMDFGDTNDDDVDDAREAEQPSPSVLEEGEEETQPTQVYNSIHFTMSGKIFP